MQRIVIPPTREEFEAKVRTFCTKTWFKRVMFAWEKCEEIHAYAREDGSRYYHHPWASAWILIIEVGIRDPRLIILELLHDTGEEKKDPFTYEDVERVYRDEFLTLGHKAITKLPGQPPAEYTRQVFAGGVKVVIVKFADRLHNLRTLRACDPDKQKRVMIDTWIYYYPHSGDYVKFLESASKKEKETIDLLWSLIVDELNILMMSKG
jgi:GTP pyrophosphokinase